MAPMSRAISGVLDSRRWHERVFAWLTRYLSS
jgi:hypothetical protein